MSDKLIQALSKLCNCVSWRTDKCAACKAAKRISELEAERDEAEAWASNKEDWIARAEAAKAALERVHKLEPLRADAYSEDAPVILYDDLAAALEERGDE